MASALAYRDFRRLWASSLCSWSSQWIQQAALGWVVYEITGSGALLGAVLGARAIPMFLLTPLSGVAADRYDRRLLLQSSQLLACAVSLAFGVALALGAVSTWMLFVFTVLMGASHVMDRPARMTTAFELVPREVAAKAVALNTVGFSLMRILGPMSAGWLIAWVGAAGTFFVQAVLFGASALVALAVAFPGKSPRKSDRGAVAEMMEALRFAASDARTRLLLVLGALPFFLLVPVWSTLLPIYAKDAFAGGPQALGLLLTGVGAGGTLGGLAANALARVERQGRLQVGWILVMCAAIAGLSWSPTLAIAVACTAVGGAAEMGVFASNMAAVQMAAPEAMRGRISGLMMLNPVLISLGALAAGSAADRLGVRGASLALAVATAAAVLLLYVLSPQLREMKLR